MEELSGLYEIGNKCPVKISVQYGRGKVSHAIRIVPGYPVNIQGLEDLQHYITHPLYSKTLWTITEGTTGTCVSDLRARTKNEAVEMLIMKINEIGIPKYKMDIRQTITLGAIAHRIMEETVERLSGTCQKKT